MAKYRSNRRQPAAGNEHAKEYREAPGEDGGEDRHRLSATYHPSAHGSPLLQLGLEGEPNAEYMAIIAAFSLALVNPFASNATGSVAATSTVLSSILLLPGGLVRRPVELCTTNTTAERVSVRRDRQRAHDAVDHEHDVRGL